MEETINPGDAPVWKRSASVLTVFMLIVTLSTPVLGWVWGASLRLASVEQRVQDAKLPEEHDRLLKIERDVEWIRRMLEKGEKGGGK